MDNITTQDPKKHNQSCFSSAINLLARREHSATELKRKLLERGWDSTEIDTTLDKLQQENLQSDMRFVECYIRARANRGFGPLHIKNELRIRGVAKNLIQEGMKNAEINWQILATTVYKKKFGNIAPKNFKERTKRMNFLQNKGFYISSDIECTLSNEYQTA